jgi:hypothetical protein
MKRYLLTWYGITDLRAALGLEPTDGPILSALRTKKFSNATILAYTDPRKDEKAFTDDLRGKWRRWREADVATRLQFPRDQAQVFVDAVSNTAAGHVLFVDWLKAELVAAGISCEIEITPRELQHLNDAQGIYNAAASALKVALADASEKTITSFISPGTPVMAYTWALIASTNPQHGIGVIASSDPRKPPETICLPKELLMPMVGAQQAAPPSRFDVVIHLLGRERMPIYFGMIQFQAREHIFITTQEYHAAATDLSQLLPRGSRSKTFIIQDPFTPAETRMAIEKHVDKLPAGAKAAVNLTGGTKLMFSGALAACWERGLEPFYFEVSHHNIIFLRDGTTVPFHGAKSVADFFAVNGFDVVTRGRWEDKPCREARLGVSQKLWEARKALGGLYGTRDFRGYRVPWGSRSNPPFDFRWGTSCASFKKGRAILTLNGESITVPNCEDFGEYLGGGWLEEYVFSLLRPLEADGSIHDLRIGIEVGYAGKIRQRMEPPIGEFDCIFTDGRRLWLVECKAGTVKQVDIQKLENNLRVYGGVAARGILVTSFPLTPAHVSRISSSTSICAVHPQILSTEVLRDIVCS